MIKWLACAMRITGRIELDELAVLSTATSADIDMKSHIIISS